MKKHKKKVLQTNLDIAVLIPARNEPTIGETIWSIKRQTVKPGCVVIVLNNCTDNGETKRLAKKACKRFQLNYKILEMKNNPHMKAGALNFGFDWIGGNLPAVKYIVQMDADSQLGVNFIERTAEALDKEVNAEIGALSCAFTGKSGLATNRREAVIMWHQRLEYVRYHDSGIQKNVNVLSGTGSTFRVSALNRLHNARGYVWDVSSLVEDYELTLALRLAGWQTRKALKFQVFTDLMPTIAALINQRLRWQRGTFDELRRVGFNRVTAPDVLKQWAHGLLTLLNVIAWAYVLSVWLQQGLGFSWIFAIILAVMAFRAGYHARSMGWRSALLASSLVPDALYGVIRNIWWLRALYASITVKTKSWT